MKKIIKGLLRLLPQKDMILFESHSDYCDNTRALFDYMIDVGLNQKFKLIWLVEYPERFRDVYIDNVTFHGAFTGRFRDTIKYIYYLSVAKFAFFSHRSPLIKLNRKEVFVNLWHGTGVKNPSFMDLGYGFDYVLYSSDFFKDSYIKFLSCKPDQLLPLGNIRNDLLFKPSHEMVKLSGKQFDKVIMWMPTFRKHKSGRQEFHKEVEIPYGIPIVRSEEMLDALNAELEKRNQLLIVKLHPAQDMTYINLNSLENIIFLTNDDIDSKNIKLYGLVSEMDALITDFSSIYVDYLLLDRPIGFTMEDNQEYITGFFFDDVLEYLPGHHINDYDEIINYLEDVHVGFDEYSVKRKKVNEMFNSYRDGKLAQRVVDTFLLD